MATAALNQELDLDELGLFKEIFHDSEVYGGRVAYFKTSTMEGKISFFSSGKMISVGTKSEKKAFLELEYAKNFLIEKNLIKPTPLQSKIRNIVVTMDYGKNIELEALSETSKMIYEPEQFPGGIMRIKEPHKASVLIFASGKIVVVGLKFSNEIEPTIQKLVNIIEKKQID